MADFQPRIRLPRLAMTPAIAMLLAALMLPVFAGAATVAVQERPRIPTSSPAEQARLRDAITRRSNLPGLPTDAAPGSVITTPDDPLFDLRFPGGTVADYLEAVQQASGKRNIVAMAGTELVAVPAITLDGINTLAAVSAIDSMRVLQADGTRASVNANFKASVFTVSVEISDYRREPHRYTIVHGLAEFMQSNYSIDAILSSIEVALDLSGDTESKLRYHEDTRMLFVHTSENVHHTVTNILAELRRQAEFVQESIPEDERIRREIAALEERISRHMKSRDAIVTERIPTANARLNQIRMRIREVSREIEQGATDPTLEHDLATLYRTLERATIEKEAIEALSEEQRLLMLDAKSERDALQEKLDQLK